MRKTITRNTDHTIEIAHNGVEAQKILLDQRFDLIITDIIMPDIDGFELIDHIGSRYSNTKIIAISGGGKIASDLYLTVAERIGAALILKKPFSADELLAAIKGVIPGQ